MGDESNWPTGERDPKLQQPLSSVVQWMSGSL